MVYVAPTNKNGPPRWWVLRPKNVPQHLNAKLKIVSKSPASTKEKRVIKGTGSWCSYYTEKNHFIPECPSEYQAAHLGFFVFIMEFPTLFSMQELSWVKNYYYLTSQQSALPRLTTPCQPTEWRDLPVRQTRNKNILVQIKMSFGSKVILCWRPKLSFVRC